MKIEFKRVHTTQNIIISSFILIIGIVTYFFHTAFGIFLIIVGLAMLVFYKTGYKALDNKIMLKREQIDICKRSREQVISFLNGAESIGKLQKPTDNGLVYIELFYNREHHVGYAQVFDYIDYSYEPITSIIQLEGNKADIFISICTDIN